MCIPGPELEAFAVSGAEVTDRSGETMEEASGSCSFLSTECISVEGVSEGGLQGMSVDMNSQASDSNEDDFGPNSEEEEDEGGEEEDQGDIADYYEGVASDVEQQGADAFDPEEYQFTCLSYRESQRVLTEEVNSVASALKVLPAVAKLILVHFHWQASPQSLQCGVCLQLVRKDALLSLPCQHSFCKSCWEQHCTVLVKDGVGVGISCMAQDCSLQMPEDFVLPLLPGEELKEKYRRYLFRDYVESHFQLQLCPGADCPIVIQCRQMYHAPTDCGTIRKWLTKCADDSETANYISAHTKDCPKCNICIEKNGGCNHMSQQAQAREALKKYLFYFERWENHNKSLQLEAQTYQRIQEKIQERFEYQQAQLEAEIENLSWKVERADSYERGVGEGELSANDRGDLENQMHIAEQRRRTLLKDFHDT
ncbi:hypothetical protein JZ751_003314 [Albula glossodonta]|uniref:RING-type domain-containing protein n=1 Tax=Albula glossodonta TaxID=121402 RepID=A0A8T2NEB4_9TELE|nr:hypothetical protein JZ751_003314 [Albula glossodonta]